MGLGTFRLGKFGLGSKKCGTNELSSPFDCNEISNLELWIDFADSRTIEKAANNNFQKAFDKSKRKLVAVDGGIETPAVVTNGINGLSSVRFVSTPTGSIVVAFGRTLTQPTTIFSVIKVETTVNAVFYYDGITSGNRHALYDHTGSTGYGFFGGTQLTGGTVDTNPHIFRAVYNTTSSVLYKDGTSIISGNAGSNTLTGLTLGANNAGATNFDGFLGEIIVYNKVLSTTEVTQVQTYLSKKWKITIA